jgi:hypothetical protein
MHCVDNRDGSCDVDFVPTEPGNFSNLLNEWTWKLIQYFF